MGECYDPATGRYGTGICGLKISIVSCQPSPQPVCKPCSCQPTTCPQCGQICPEVVPTNNCYNAPNQNARYREYLEYLDRLQGKKPKTNNNNNNNIITITTSVNNN